jgi:hypothetical protein
MEPKKTGLGPSRLTEPEEAESAYQDHFFLILCENLATSAMMGNDTTRKGCFLKENSESAFRWLHRNRGPEEPS